MSSPRAGIDEGWGGERRERGGWKSLSLSLLCLFQFHLSGLVNKMVGCQAGGNREVKRAWSGEVQRDRGGDQE